MTDSGREIRAAMASGTAAVTAVNDAMGRKADRRDVFRIAAVAAFTAAAVAVLVSVPVAIAGAADQAAQEIRQDAIEQRQQEDRDRADAAYSAAQEANAELERRGQPRVDVPRPSEDPKAVQDTLVAAAVAGTLAELPEVLAPISQQQLATAAGAAVARYMANNPAPGVTPEAVSAQVAAYLRQNPPAPGPPGTTGLNGTDGATPPCMNTEAQCQGAPGPTGEQGPEGKPGPPPTADQIMAAFYAEAQDNPSLLCAGTDAVFTRIEGVLVQPEGELVPRRQDIWTCIPPSGE